MTRKTQIVTVTANNRDKGKKFQLREMPAYQGCKWAYRVMLALSRSGIQIPEGIFNQGFAGLASFAPYLLLIGWQSLEKAQWSEIEPLIDELMQFVKFVPPGCESNDQLYQDLFPGDNSQAEEWSTYSFLQKGMLELHLGFSLAAALSTSVTPSPEQGSPSA